MPDREAKPTDQELLDRAKAMEASVEDEIEDEDEDIAPEDETSDEPIEDEVDEDVAPEDEDEPEEDEPEVELPVDKPAKKAAKSENRFQRLANENRELRESTRRSTEELEQLRRAQAQRQKQADEQARYTEWYNGLNAEEKWFEDRRVEIVRQNARINNLEFETADRNDKADFRQTLADNPNWRKYEAQVEEMLKQVRATGVNATRDIILTQILGQAMRQVKKAPVNKKAAQQRVRSERTRPSSPGGDTPRERRGAAPDSVAALEARLKGRVF